jgi:SAM-dependent MidA family methyltransferase
MTRVALKNKIIQEIAEQGAMPIDRFMSLALSDPKDGYYQTKDPIGQAGDFITSPEISQIFGELIGIWCLMTWYEMGSPESFILVEMGPGHGTLMVDILRATNLRPNFLSSAEIYMVETSPYLRQIQQKKLSSYPIEWVTTLESLPDKPLILIANEFFDALPIRQVQRSGHDWYERSIHFREDSLIFTLSPLTRSYPEIALESKEGDILEIQDIGTAIASDIGKRIDRKGGVALIIDYGYKNPAYGDSLQAVKKHQKVSILETPGEADITAHVNFSALAKAANPALVTPVITQAEFLKSLYIQERVTILIQKNPHLKSVLEESYHRLIDKDAMGELFKVMALYSKDFEKPIGFYSQSINT